MKIIVGLLLLATAYSYPVAENPEAPIVPAIADQKPVVDGLPLSIPDQQALSQKQEHPVHDSAESSESEESKENCSEQKRLAVDSNERGSGEKAAIKREEKLEEPKNDFIKEEVKPIEPLPALKASDPKDLAPEEPKLSDPLVPQIAAKSIPAEPQEKPLALPTLTAEEKPREDAPKLAATEIKQEAALPSEQKVEVSPAAEEKLPELRKADVEEKIPAPVVPAAIEPVVPAVAAEIKPEGEKKAKAEEIKDNQPGQQLEGKTEQKREEKIEEKREEKISEAKSLESLPIPATEARPIEEKPVEIKPELAKTPLEEPKQPEGLPSIPLDQPKLIEPKPIELIKPAEIKLDEAKPLEEKLPLPSASSS